MSTLDIQTSHNPEAGYIEPVVIQRLMKLGDLVVFALLSFALTRYFVGMVNVFELTVAVFNAWLAATANVFLLRQTYHYGIRKLLSPWPSVLTAGVVVIAAGGGVWCVLHFGFFGLTLDWFWGWCLSALAYVFASRALFKFMARPAERDGRFVRRIAIVGGGQHAEDVLNLLEESARNQIEVIGIFDDRKDSRSPDSVKKYQKLGTVSDLHDYARHNRIDQIIVTIPQTAEVRLLQVLKRLWELPIDIRISALSSKLRLQPRSYSYIGSLPLLDAFDRPLAGWNEFTKNIFDRCAATLMLIMLSPVLAAVAIAIRLESKGPVIFRQKRYGFNNELITVFKFRSMYTDLCDRNASKLVTKDDPRVTRVGRFIRKTSLDELPQLANVVLGTMSLVGPRPHAISAKADNHLYEDVVDGYFARHRIKPGITGWAQVNGYRGETDTREKIEGRVKLDLEYINKWSILFDIYIILMTPFSLLFKNENAY
ncbi:undecaprenyl-phosphate glucose phosphotransferase [Coralliovum pocilloporae]|uniref:undecaprenyl-phosphate glucose phosphotransferase n=1 Tax=Coralliovum pocilloporae TaxID=3066369 RepID=UPI003306AF4B